jgi:hypothetical protein
VRYATILLGPLVAALIVMLAIAGSAHAAQPRVAVEATVKDDAPEPADVQAASGIVEFRAVPARLRGRIDVSWKYGGRAFAGAFVVERSTNGSAWRSVAACTTAYNAQKAAYACTDAYLTSGTTYAYRACVAAKGTSCASSGATKPVSVKAP